MPSKRHAAGRKEIVQWLFILLLLCTRKKKSRATLRRLVVFTTSSLPLGRKDRLKLDLAVQSLFNFFVWAKTLIYIEKIGDYKPTIRTSIRSSSSFDR